MKVFLCNFTLTKPIKFKEKMKIFLSLILIFITGILPVIAQDSGYNSTPEQVGLEINRKQESSTGRHRVPARINIEAWYNAESGSIEIVYDGEAEGEVFLYLNGNIIGYDSNINTSFQISAPGLYKIEIVTESWTATGQFRL